MRWKRNERERITQAVVVASVLDLFQPKSWKVTRETRKYELRRDRIHKVLSLFNQVNDRPTSIFLTECQFLEGKDEIFREIVEALSGEAFKGIPHSGSPRNYLYQIRRQCPSGNPPEECLNLGCEHPYTKTTQQQFKQFLANTAYWHKVESGESRDSKWWA